MLLVASCLDPVPIQDGNDNTLGLGPNIDGEACTRRPPASLKSIDVLLLVFSEIEAFITLLSQSLTWRKGRPNVSLKDLIQCSRQETKPARG